MSGQEGGRGYAVQWVISVLDGLDETSWTHSTFEPNEKSQKVDCLFETRDAAGKVIKSCAKQIKSSINQFSISSARKIGKELKTTYPAATEHEVVLVGPTTDGIATLKEPLGVTYKVKSLDLDGMYKHAAQSVGLFLERLKMPEPGATARELIARGLTTKISEWSSEGKMISREEFTKHIVRWIKKAIRDLPKEHESDHDRRILRTVHAELPPQFIDNFLESTNYRRPSYQATLIVRHSLDFLNQQRFVPRDKELAKALKQFLQSMHAIDTYLGNYFALERGALRFTPGKISLAQEYQLKRELARLDLAAQKSHKRLVECTQARWPEIISEFNQPD